jgi:16S rRNA (cytosine967-C5)-methyltransferase
LHPDTLDVLRLGVYQLVFCTQIPAHAAVHETIELLPTNLQGVRNFANALLRQLSEIVTSDEGLAPSPFAIPQEAGRYRLLNRPLMPDPQREPVGYLIDGFSWPAWLADQWFTRFGFDECVRLGFWFNSPPPLWLRARNRQKLQAEFASRGIESSFGEAPQSLKLETSSSVRELPGYDAGEFAVQDHTSQLVAAALDPKPGWQVLDLCAAPGGKTTHLAELMQNQGRILACDIEPDRLATVQTLATRMQTSIVETQLLNGPDSIPAGPFDAALVDVPCSNTGVLGRRPEVRWRLQPGEFEHLIRLQRSLLMAALQRVCPGGVVVYSTCSIEPDENQRLVRSVLEVTQAVVLESEQVSEPGFPSDGGYWAKLRRRGE